MSTWKDERKSPPPPPPPSLPPPPPTPPPPPPPDKKLFKNYIYPNPIYNGVSKNNDNFNTLSRNIDEKLCKSDSFLKKNYFKNFFKTASSSSSSITSGVSSIVQELPLKMASNNNTLTSNNSNVNSCLGVTVAAGTALTATAGEDRRNLVNMNCEVNKSFDNNSKNIVLEVPIVKIENNNNLLIKSDNNNLSKELCSEYSSKNNSIQNMILNYEDGKSDGSNKADKLDNDSSIEMDREMGSFVLPRVMLKPGVSPNYNEDSGFVQCCDKSVRERLPSTSHYSTEKSGSSGYYSSNLYSVSSVDENIYSEPITQQKNNNVVNIDNSSSNSDNISDGRSSNCTNSNIQLDNLSVKHKTNEMKCLESLQKSITELENSLSIHDTQQQQLQRQQNHIHPNQIPLLQQLQQHQPKPLPTIMEGLDGQIPPRPIWPTDFDDSLMDINLDSFIMRNESPINNNADNLSDRSQIDLIGLESPLPIILSNSTNPLKREHQKQQQYLQQQQLQLQQSQYEEFLNFHNTKNMLEVIRTKLENLLESTATSSTATTETGITTPIITEPDPQFQSNFKNNPFIINNNNDNPNKVSFYHQHQSSPSPQPLQQPSQPQVKSELERNIINLKTDIDCYLKLMNQQNEAEIKQFCTGLSKNSKLLSLQNAVEQKNNNHHNKLSLHGTYRSTSNFYEVVNECEPGLSDCFSVESDELQKMPSPSPPPPPPPPHRNYHHNMLSSNMSKYNDVEALPSQFETMYVRDGFSLSYIHRINPFMDGVRIMSSPKTPDNFKRRSICFSSDHIYKYNEDVASSMTPTTTMTNSSAENKNSKGAKNNPNDLSQMKQNLTLQNIMLMGSLGDKSFIGSDKDKMLLEWHRNKPSFWELYYGPNRDTHKPHQTLISKMKIGRKTNTSMAYPSTRPETDFTLDVPRAEQLRIKMKKEKQFRSRCRLTIYFLSFIIFLLTVMVVSLVLTRGKRMFGSMI